MNLSRSTFFNTLTTLSLITLTAHTAIAQSLFVPNVGGGTVTKVTLAGVQSNFSMIGVSGQLTGAAISTDGYLYLANSNVIRKVDSLGNATTFASGFSNSYGIVFDSSGNLYVANQGSGVNSIKKVTPAGVVTNFANIPNAQGLAFDSSGNLYATSSANTKVVKIDPTGATVTDYFTLPATTGQGLAFDGSGNLYAAGTNGNIFKITAVNTGALFGTVANARGVVTDASNNLYVSSQVGSVVQFTPAGAQSTLASGGNLSSPWFITLGSVTAGGSAPEPGTLALLALGGTLVLARRRRK